MSEPGQFHKRLPCCFEHIAYDIGFELDIFGSTVVFNSLKFCARIILARVRWARDTLFGDTRRYTDVCRIPWMAPVAPIRVLPRPAYY